MEPTHAIESRADKYIHFLLHLYSVHELAGLSTCHFKSLAGLAKRTAMYQILGLCRALHHCYRTLRFLELLPHELGEKVIVHFLLLIALSKKRFHHSSKIFKLMNALFVVVANRGWQVIGESLWGCRGCPDDECDSGNDLSRLRKYCRGYVTYERIRDVWVAKRKAREEDNISSDGERWYEGS